jgi:two-component system, cell cycle sensor histidine kinase and response regulator CckA
MQKTEHQFQQASQEEAIISLTGRIIHDLNNTLSSILGFAELVKMGLSIGENVDKDLGDILSAGLKARDLVNQLFISNRQVSVQKMSVEITLLIKESIKLIRALLPASIEISFRPGVFKGFILTDPVQFHRILIILCSVVSHTMKEKAGLIEIRLQHMRIGDKTVLQHINLIPGRYLQMSIGDAGHDMPKDTTAHLVVPLSTPVREDLFPGLSLVRGMVREMGGAIPVCNESEKGTIFHILFPEYEKKSGEESNGSIIDHR